MVYILAQQSMVENEYGKSGHLSFFTSLKHLMMLVKSGFRGFIPLRQSSPPLQQRPVKVWHR